MRWSEIPQGKDELLARAIKAFNENSEEAARLNLELPENERSKMNDCISVMDDAEKFIKRNTHDEDNF